ncbi:sigma-70 family RNA polymerase sigma factor [Novosphingobium sp. ERW19]|uniref:RNA polymerase sigma factor n=1 Tax=Novosphingobium sp. ERW19 TaxID=2726186 RepID=UPI001F106916|nr:sigma-70 family RNA polymerase sigma factor [Novosphingobium sp. ERW19]
MTNPFAAQAGHDSHSQNTAQAHPPDVAAIEAEYRHSCPALLRKLARKTGMTLAEDLVQQVFVRLMANRQRQIENLSGYVRVAADNARKDLVRQELRQHQYSHEPFEDIHPGCDLQSQLEARDRLARLEQALSRLKPLTRNIFLARRLDGYSYAEIAEQTGLSVRGVEKQMSRALKALARHLAED